MHCSNCGRFDCHCGERSARQCSTHRTYLIVMAMPYWTGKGTDESPHRISHFLDYLGCPAPDCLYARPYKLAPGSETRADNRKTGVRMGRNEICAHGINGYCSFCDLAWEERQRKAAKDRA